MVKSKFLSMQQYLQQLTGLVQETEKAGAHVAPFFEKLDAAIKADSLSEMPAAEFKEIAAEFDDVVEFYQTTSQQMTALKAPARLLGSHASLTKVFAQYTAATEMMAAALDVKNQTVDMTAFNQSEADQDALISKFYGQVQRLMSTGV